MQVTYASVFSQIYQTEKANEKYSIRAMCSILISYQSSLNRFIIYSQHVLFARLLTQAFSSMFNSCPVLSCFNSECVEWIIALASFFSTWMFALSKHALWSCIFPSPAFGLTGYSRSNSRASPLLKHRNQKQGVPPKYINWS